jgi:hypothetical protein
MYARPAAVHHASSSCAPSQNCHSRSRCLNAARSATEAPTKARTAGGSPSAVAASANPTVRAPGRVVLGELHLLWDTGTAIVDGNMLFTRVGAAGRTGWECACLLTLIDLSTARQCCGGRVNQLMQHTWTRAAMCGGGRLLRSIAHTRLDRRVSGVALQRSGMRRSAFRKPTVGKSTVAPGRLAVESQAAPLEGEAVFPCSFGPCRG